MVVQFSLFGLMCQVWVGVIIFIVMWISFLCIDRCLCICVGVIGLWFIRVSMQVQLLWFMCYMCRLLIVVCGSCLCIMLWIFFIIGWCILVLSRMVLDLCSSLIVQCVISIVLMMFIIGFSYDVLKKWLLSRVLIVSSEVVVLVIMWMQVVCRLMLWWL